MKKLFCILLTLAMLLCAIPMTVTVSAEDETVDTTAWNYSGETFTHADDAAAKNAGRSCRIGEEGRNAKYFWNVGNALAALIQNPNYYDRTIHLIGESATFGKRKSTAWGEIFLRSGVLLYDYFGCCKSCYNDMVY